MYRSDSKLLSQPSVQTAALDSARIARVATGFDQLHAEVDQNPDASMALKLQKVRAKQKLMAELDNAGVQYSS